MKRMIYLILMTVCVNASAQTFLTNDQALISVQSGKLVTIEGSMFNFGAGITHNYDSIYISHDIINNSFTGTFAPSNGTVILNGDTQFIAGSMITEIHRLDIAQGSTLPVIMGNDVSVGFGSGNLLLGDRPIWINQNRLQIANDDTSAISRGSGYVVSETDASSGYGELEWVTAEQTGRYEIPFGTYAGDYIPMDVEITSAGVGPTAGITAFTYPTDATASINNRPLPVGVSHLQSNGVENAEKTIDRFWRISRSGYTTDPSGNLLLSYVDAEWDASAGSTNLISEPNLQAQRWNGGISDWEAPLGTNSSSQNTTSGISQLFGIWTMADNSSPLPIELLSFEPTRISPTEVRVDWSTAMEINNDRFEIYRLTGDGDFKEVYRCPGQLYSESVIEYSIIDPNDYPGTSYYFLRQVDTDNSHSDSEIQPVDNMNLSTLATPTLFPTVTNDKITIEYPIVMSGWVTISDAKGKLVHQEVIQVNNQQIDLGGLASGQYFVHVLSDKTRHTFRVEKVH